MPSITTLCDDLVSTLNVANFSLPITAFWSLTPTKSFQDLQASQSSLVFIVPGSYTLELGARDLKIYTWTINVIIISPLLPPTTEEEYESQRKARNEIILAEEIMDFLFKTRLGSNIPISVRLMRVEEREEDELRYTETQITIEYQEATNV